MAKYNFKAKTKTGEIKEGTIDAVSSESAVFILQKNGLFPVKIESEKEIGQLSRIFLKYYERVTDKELMVFFRQLAILIEARVPIISALTAISEQSTNRYFGKVLGAVINDINERYIRDDNISQRILPISTIKKFHHSIFHFKIRI